MRSTSPGLKENLENPTTWRKLLKLRVHIIEMNFGTRCHRKISLRSTHQASSSTCRNSLEPSRWIWEGRRTSLWRESRNIWVTKERPSITTTKPTKTVPTTIPQGKNTHRTGQKQSSTMKERIPARNLVIKERGQVDYRRGFRISSISRRNCPTIRSLLGRNIWCIKDIMGR